MREMVVDLRRLSRQSAEIVAPPIAPRRSAWRWAIGVGIVVLALAGIWWWVRPDVRARTHAEWAQLTSFPDSVSQPALSPDGRILTFVRGPDTFIGTGQIYVKFLPDGEPKQLTSDALQKMSPVFSPDGSKISYTVLGPQNWWETWEVPLLGGAPRRWLPNASGLAWNGAHNIVFSEIIYRLEGNHMKIVAATESRAGERDLYVPHPKGAMAHRSFPSPDGQLEKRLEGWLR